MMCRRLDAVMFGGDRTALLSASLAPEVPHCCVPCLHLIWPHVKS